MHNVPGAVDTHIGITQLLSMRAQIRWRDNQVTEIKFYKTINTKYRTR